jgi:hypothetical protein
MMTARIFFSHFRLALVRRNNSLLTIRIGDTALAGIGAGGMGLPVE